jgi:NAD(P)-dependent dehydrogenase (short-subunit alcohol dehydrogenase family)
VLCARSEDKGRAVCEDLRSRGVEVVWVTADISGEGDARRVFDAALASFGRVDLLVNNAARLRSRAFLDLTPEEYEASLESNLRMVYWLSRLCAAWMSESGGGRIVNLSSVGGLRAHRGLSGYDASKGAIDALTRSMAVDLAPHGIRVNAVAPGNSVHGRPRVLPGVPLGRSATSEDIGAAVAFLASDASSYITGQVMYVDGGLTAQLTPPGIFI